MQYLLGNFAKNTIAAPVKQPAPAATLRTMFQFAPLLPCHIVEWGYSFDGSAAATPGAAELIETGTVFATMSAALVAADISAYDAEALLYNSGDPTSKYIDVSSTAKTGYANAAVTEGTPSVVRNLGGPQLVAPTSELIYQSPLGFRAYCQDGKAVRIRVTAVPLTNFTCYILVEF